MFPGKIKDFIGGLRMDDSYDEAWDGSDCGLRQKRERYAKYSISNFNIDDFIPERKSAEISELVIGRETGLEFSDKEPDTELSFGE